MWWLFQYEIDYPYPIIRKINNAALWVDNEAAAVDLAARLRFISKNSTTYQINEMRPSRICAAKGGLARADFFHSVCFLSFIASRAGVSPDYLFGDNGIIHLLSHVHQYGYYDDKLRTRLIEGIVWLESVCPGLPPDDIYLPLDDFTTFFSRQIPDNRIGPNDLEQARVSLNSYGKPLPVDLPGV